MTTKIRHIASSVSPNILPDPGDGGALPVNEPGRVKITTAGAETRTLANPPEEGMTLELLCEVHAGNCVITAATGVNGAGNTTITLTAAGSYLLLTSVSLAGTLRWQAVANDAVTLAA